MDLDHSLNIFVQYTLDIDAIHRTNQEDCLSLPPYSIEHRPTRGGQEE